MGQTWTGVVEVLIDRDEVGDMSVSGYEGSGQVWALSSIYAIKTQKLRPVYVLVQKEAQSQTS